MSDSSEPFSDLLPKSMSKKSQEGADSTQFIAFCRGREPNDVLIVYIDAYTLQLHD